MTTPSGNNKRISLLVSLEPMAVGRAHLSSVEGWMVDSMLKHLNYMIDSVTAVQFRDVNTSIEFHRILEELMAHRGVLLLTKKSLAEEQAQVRKGIADVAQLVDGIRIKLNDKIMSAAAEDDVEDGRGLSQIEGYGLN